jgi:hypothetical protein
MRWTLHNLKDSKHKQKIVYYSSIFSAATVWPSLNVAALLPRLARSYLASLPTACADTNLSHFHQMYSRFISARLVRLHHEHLTRACCASTPPERLIKSLKPVVLRPRFCFCPGY